MILRIIALIIGEVVISVAFAVSLKGFGFGGYCCDVL